MSDFIKSGTTDVTTYFQLRNVADGTDATGKVITDFDLQYVRSGDTPSAKVDATALAAANSAHADNKMIEVDSTDQPALYRVDWPDAAFASGVREVILTVKHTDIQTASLRVLLDAPVDAVEISGSATAADNVESVVLGTGAADDVDLSARSLTISQDVAATPAVLIENTNNDNAVEIAAATGNGLDIQVSVTGHAANLSGSGAARYGLNCVSVNDAGAYFEGSTAEANGEGIVIEGKGTDSGLKVIAGTTGIGVDIAGGATSGDGINIATTDGYGIEVASTGTGKDGIYAHAADGNGLRVIAAGTNNHGLFAGASGTGHGISASGAGGGNGAKFLGNVAGYGIEVSGGSTAGTGAYISGGTGGKGVHVESDSNTAFDVQSGTGKSMYIRTSSGSQDALTIDSDGGGGVRIESLGSVGNDYGLYIKGLGPNGHAIELVGNGAGSGIDITPGATGVGLNIAGGGTSGDGISIATTDGDGIKVVAAGTGKNAIDLSAATDGKALEINQQTKTGSEDIFELMYARLAGKNQMDNTGGSSEIEVKLSNYAETSVLKTLELKKPDGTANTEILNVNALAGEAEA
jgi:hypothetical protein